MKKSIPHSERALLLDNFLMLLSCLLFFSLSKNACIKRNFRRNSYQGYYVVNAFSWHCFWVFFMSFSDLFQWIIPRLNSIDYSNLNYRHTLFHCTSFNCASQILWFLQTEDFWQPCSKQIYTIFPTAFIPFMSVCHILIILMIFQTLGLLLYLLWWYVISDLWYYCCNFLRPPWTVTT